MNFPPRHFSQVFEIFVKKDEYLKGGSNWPLTLMFLEEGNTNPHKIVVYQMGGSEDIFGNFSALPAPCVVLSETPESTFPTRGRGITAVHAHCLGTKIGA